ncbi:MAG: glycerate kinase [Verrucomicrobia bacterium]|nr:glycerate kinase [Verrucomicrobiota bacterium]
MRYLIAPDKFKGTMDAQEVAETIAAGIRDFNSTVEVDILPLADGGEGTAALLARYFGADRRVFETVDPLGRPIEAEIFIAGREAILDLSAASGLWRVRVEEREPFRSNTYGTGKIIKYLIDNGLERIYVGLGGSATVDVGLGLGLALDYKFLGADQQLVQPLPIWFSDIERVEAPDLTQIPEVIGLADVETLLTGPQGAIYTFGPQKGLTPTQIPTLDRTIAVLAARIDQALGTNFSTIPGAGAAGGFGYGILTFAKGRLISGFNVIAEKVGLVDRMAVADVVITGEGKLDSQSLHGKGPYGVAALARRLKKPIWALAGVIEDRDHLIAHFNRLSSLVSNEVTVEQALKNPVPILRRRALEMCRSFAEAAAS